MNDLGIELSREDLDAMMDEADVNKDGRIDYAGTSRQLHVVLVPPAISLNEILTRLYSESANLRQGVWSQPKVIRDSNSDFWVNPDSDLDVCQISAKMLLASVISPSENRPVIVWEMLINILKPLQWWGKIDPEYVFKIGSPPKLDNIFRLIGLGQWYFSFWKRYSFSFYLVLVLSKDIVLVFIQFCDKKL